MTTCCRITGAASTPKASTRTTAVPAGRCGRGPRPAATIHPTAQAFIDAVQERGYPVSADLNGAEPEGVTRPELNVADGVRQSAADAYLRPFLDRPNLTVVTDAVARKLVIDGSQCSGVRYTAGGQQQTAEAGEVVLCAGAIGSPHLLMLSGIGPADALRGHGIQVAADLPGTKRDDRWSRPPRKYPLRS
jgi:choline dehydrogenase